MADRTLHQWHVGFEASRTVPIPASMVAALRALRREQAERRLLTGPAWADGGYVFDRGDGAPIDPDTFSKAFRHAVAVAGLEGVRVHDLRHAFATMLLTAGTPLRVAADVLGHATPAFTLSVYAHSTDAGLAAAAETTEAILGTALAPESQSRGESGANPSRR